MIEVLETTDIKDIYLAEFESAQATGRLGSFISADQRKKALEVYTRLGFPTKKHEEWKFTSLKPVQKHQYSFSHQPSLSKAQIGDFLLAGQDVHLLVFENGILNTALSTKIDADGVVIDSLRNQANHEGVKKHITKYATFENNSMVALNTALAADGAFVYLPDGVKLEKPIHILFVGNATTNTQAGFARVLVVGGKNSEANIVESYHSTGTNAVFTSVVTEVDIEDGAHIDIYKIQSEDDKALQFNYTQVDQEANTHSDVTTITLGGAWVRNNLHYLLNKPGCETHFYGLYVLNGSMHVDNHTLADHAAPHCHSNELYKGVMADKSNGVFNGKIMVRQDAQKTNAYQSNKNILLSDLASINTKPQLEIFADDVKCSHGATTGRLDEDSLFYLRARGIGKEQARMMLLFAFASDVVNNIKIETLKDNLMKVMAKKFNQEEE